jgi:hypothetical protein
VLDGGRHTLGGCRPRSGIDLGGARYQTPNEGAARLPRMTALARNGTLRRITRGADYVRPLALIAGNSAVKVIVIFGLIVLLLKQRRHTVGVPPRPCCLMRRATRYAALAAPHSSLPDSPPLVVGGPAFGQGLPPPAVAVVLHARIRVPGSPVTVVPTRGP